MFKRIVSILVSLGLGLSFVPSLALATVSVSAGPSSLVVDPMLAKASSNPVGLFEFTGANTEGETLSSISVQVDQNATTTVSGSDLSNLAVYKDDGNGVFNSSVDALVGTQTTVNVGATTVVLPTASTAFTGKFFVSLSTGASWSGSAPADSITVTFPANGISTSATTTPTTTPVTTASLTADTQGPTLTSAVAKNTGGTNAKEAGDSVDLTFSESTNKPVVTSSTIGSFFTVNNGHSFLDTMGNLGASTWNTAGTVLTLTLSGTSSPTSTLPSLVVGDVVTVVPNSAFTDLAGNQTSGTQSLTGNFGGALSGGGNNEGVKGNCANSLINGRLYKIGSEPTVYLAAACRLKPFRGAAVFHARGQKFQNIIVLSAAPANVTVSNNDPVLPTAGTLVKGKDKTVWFVNSHGKRKGFVSGSHFTSLGFDFKKVKIIEQTDLDLIPTDNPIQPNESHPDGAIIKCGNSAAVFQVIGNAKFPFANGEAFTSRGNSFEHVLTVDCGRFRYTVGAAVNP